MIDMARGINPTIEVRAFAEGVNLSNVDRFLDDVDVFVDGLDFFAFDARDLVFGRCAARAIPATTVAPLGMGAALLNLMPGGMTFEQYFGLRQCPESERPIHFLLGLAPAMLHRRYLADASFVNLDAGRGPSTAMACQLCAGIAATEAVKIMLKRGPVVAAPYGVQFDAYRYRIARTWRPGGHRNPLSRLVRRLARRELSRLSRRS
jgi:hypothetical protein